MKIPAYARQPPGVTDVVGHKVEGAGHGGVRRGKDAQSSEDSALSVALAAAVAAAERATSASKTNRGAMVVFPWVQWVKEVAVQGWQD